MSGPHARDCWIDVSSYLLRIAFIVLRGGRQVCRLCGTIELISINTDSGPSPAVDAGGGFPPSTQPCNASKWTRDTWHHIQISTSRDDLGNVTYHSVWFDGVEAPINQTVNSDFALGWGLGALVANFQVDGVGSSGSSTVYVDNLTMDRW